MITTPFVDTRKPRKARPCEIREMQRSATQLLRARDRPSERGPHVARAQWPRQLVLRRVPALVARVHSRFYANGVGLCSATG